MAGKPSDKSVRAIAARLSVELGRAVTQKAVKVWKAKGYPLNDAVALEKKLRNQERAPKKTNPPKSENVDPASDDAETPSHEGEPPATQHLDIEHELKQLQRKLLEAKYYEDARTIRMQIAGVRDVLKSLREQGHYVTRESQDMRGGLLGEAVKVFVMKIPSDLPQMLIGLDYPAAFEKCTDYAHNILTRLHESQSNQGDD